MQNYVRALWVLLLIASVSLNTFVLKYTFALENQAVPCDCAVTDVWQHQYIKAHLLLQNFVFGCLLIIFMTKISLFDRIHDRVFVIFLPFTIVYSIVTFTYVRMLEKSKCTCSESVERLVMQFVSLVQTSLFTMYGIFIVLGLAGVWWFNKRR